MLVAAALRAEPVPIRIDPGDCRRDVHVVASGAPADDVLHRMAEALGFELSIEGPLAHAVQIDAIDTPERLVARLLPRDGFMIVRRADPRCPGRSTIARLFVVVPGAAPRAPAAPRALDPGEQAYLRAHGLAPPAAASSASANTP